MFLGWILGLAPFATAFSGWVSETTWFLFGAVALGIAFTVTGLDKRLAYGMMHRFKSVTSSFSGLLFIGMILTYILMVVTASSTAVTVIMCALLFPFVAFFASPGQKTKMGSVLLAMVALVANSVTARGFLTSGAMNLVVWGTLRAAKVPITWLAWYLVLGIPTILLLVLTYLGLRYVLFRPEVTKLPPEAVAGLEEQYKKLPAMSTNEKKLVFWFLVALVLWVSGTWTGIDPGLVAVAVGAALFTPVIGVMSFEDLFKRMNWGFLGMVAGVLALPAIGSADGFLKVLANFMGPALAYVTANHWAFLPFMEVVSTLGVATMSLAAPAVMLPPVFGLAPALGTSPALISMVYVAMYPTFLFYMLPQSLIAFSYGTFTQKDYFKIGFMIYIFWFLLSLVLWPTYWAWLHSIGII